MDQVKVAYRPTWLGVALILIFILFFSVWAYLAPLSSASIAPGTVSVESHRKVVQHLEGGIIDGLLVQEGDFVHSGQALVRLSDISARANYDLLMHQLNMAEAQKSRLIAERDDQDQVQFPKHLIDKESHNPQIAKAMQGERKLFDARKQAKEVKLTILNSRITQLNEQIQGLEAQQSSVKEHMKLSWEEIQTVRDLIQDGQETKPRLMELKRELVNLEGQSGQLQAETAAAKQQIGETQLEKLNLKSEHLSEVATQLTEVQLTINDLKERLIAAEDILRRLVIVAPQDGIVTGLKFHTRGGVISPNAEVLSIVPQNDELIIEAKLKPQDIDNVQIGLSTKVHLLAYKTRNIPPIHGKVIHISADLFNEPETMQSYYLVKVKVDPQDLRLLKDVELYPGMPTEVIIEAGDRTFFEYLIDPVQQNFRRAFREE